MNIPDWAQILLAMPAAAIEIGVLLWAAKRYLGFELPKVVTIGKADLERAAFHAKEIGYIEGYRDGIADMRIIRTAATLTTEEAEKLKQRLLAAQTPRPAPDKSWIAMEGR